MHLLFHASKPKNLRYLFVTHRNHLLSEKLNNNSLYSSWRGQHTAAESDNSDSNKNRKKSRVLTEHEKSIIDSMIRVDHAGEVGADWIYRGQLAVLGKDKAVGPVIQ
ncbi:8111_t:CDS:1, partial [Ambispora leptoticha]